VVVVVVVVVVVAAAVAAAAAAAVVVIIVIPSQYSFHPIAIETHRPLNETALDILCEFGRRIRTCSGDNREGFSCSNGFQFACSNLTQFSCKMVFPWINRIDGHFS